MLLILRACAIITLTGVCLMTASCATRHIAYADLCSDLMNLEKLAMLPAEGEACAQESSYDRHSVYDSEKDRYLHWDRNADGDGGGLLPKEDGMIVMADMKGPGVIRRIWSARAGEGHVKVYIDGQEKPVLDMPFSHYFDAQNGPAAFRYPNLVYHTPSSPTAPGGFNNYVPIPFEKSCKILAEPRWGAYFHFTYSRFPKGTRIDAFTPNPAGSSAEALGQVDNYFGAGLGTNPHGERQGEQKVSGRLQARPDEPAVLGRLEGSGAITSLKIRLPEMPRKEQMLALREMVLRIYWDGNAEPAIWCSLGDFFGSAPGVNPYKSLPLGMDGNHFYSYWYMPFAAGARLEILNEGPAARDLEFSYTHIVLSGVEGLGRFHAKWHRDAFLPEHPDRAPIDWTILKTRGRGRYCGVLLNIWNPLGNWWGEGDEKFFIDDEKFPSTFGTGSEDYFGYAWCLPLLFQRALHNQTLCSDNRFHISVNRWHVADNIPFQKAFEGAIEKYFQNSRPTLYSAVAYWYLDPAGADPYGPVAAGERVDYYDPGNVMRVAGAIEGEDMEILSCDGGDTTAQCMDAWPDFPKYSGAFHLWWRHAKPGDRLTLQFEVEKAGKYEILAALTKAHDYAIAQFAVDGEEMGPQIDLYHPQVIHSGETSLGTKQLGAGSHRLDIRIVGKNPQARGAYMVGLDYLRLQTK